MSKSDYDYQKTFWMEGELTIGKQILYSPSPRSGKRGYLGYVASLPFQLGNTWCVTLDDMEPSYAKDTGKKGDGVKAASINSIYHSPIYWNPDRQVVLDHRDGTIDHRLTDFVRSALIMHFRHEEERLNA